jgi:hypothetical protein
MPCQAQIPQPPARPPPARTLSAWVSTEPRRPVVDEARHSLLRLTVHAGSGRVGFPCVAPFPLASHVPVVVSHPLPGWVAGGGWTVARKVLKWPSPFFGRTRKVTLGRAAPSELYAYRHRVTPAHILPPAHTTRAVGSLCVRLIPRSRQKWH